MTNNIGWIKLYRTIQDHWIYQDPVKLKWWIDLLLMANHEPKKVLIKNSLIEVGRGQTVRSLGTLSKRWLVTKKTVRTFLSLLEKDTMITTQGVTVSTLITICNYDIYQEKGHTTETEMGTKSTRKVNATETQSKRDLPTNKNEENDNNEKNEKKEEVRIKNTISDTGNSLHSDSIKIFCEWYDKKVGVKYPFQGGQDGAAMKTILNNIRGAITNKNKQEAKDEEILNGWKFILDNYDKWESFYQAQMKLSQISSNLANILANIKGIRKDGKFIKGEQGRLSAEDWETIAKYRSGG